MFAATSPPTIAVPVATRRRDRTTLCKYAESSAVAHSRNPNASATANPRLFQVTRICRRAQPDQSCRLVRNLAAMSGFAAGAAILAPPLFSLVRYHGVFAARSSWRALRCSRRPSKAPLPLDLESDTVRFERLPRRSRAANEEDRGAIAALLVALTTKRLRFPPLAEQGTTTMKHRSHVPLWLAPLALLATACGVDSSGMSAEGDGGGQAANPACR